MIRDIFMINLIHTSLMTKTMSMHIIFGIFDLIRKQLKRAKHAGPSVCVQVVRIIYCLMYIFLVLNVFIVIPLFIWVLLGILRNISKI